MPQGYIKEATYQFSSFYPPWKWSNSRVLQSVIQVSSLESKRKLVVPERALCGFWQNGCPKDTLRKLYINFFYIFNGNLKSDYFKKCIFQKVLFSKSAFYEKSTFWRKKHFFSAFFTKSAFLPIIPKYAYYKQIIIWKRFKR